VTALLTSVKEIPTVTESLTKTKSR